MILQGVKGSVIRVVLFSVMIGGFTLGTCAAQGGTIAGAVRGPNGAGILGAAVMAMRIGVTPMTMVHATTDAQGAYSFANLPAGNYDIQIEAPGFKPDRRSGFVLAANARLEANLSMEPEPVQPSGAQASSDPAALVERIQALEQRIEELESSTVLSEPETRVKQVEVYVDANSNISDQPTPGARRTVTYQRERVYRRQTINEKIEEALSGEAESRVQVGVNAAIAAQGAFQTKGEETEANRHAYELASADLFFTARVAQHTLFFADVVGISGPPPDLEIGGLTLLNGFTARLINQNELNLREAWLRTELFSQKLGLTVGRLDLTNYFDHNAAANDESTQFLSDALVNNPALGLAVNGAGLALTFDPKNGLNFKIGIQQSNSEALNLSDSLFSLAEIGYFATPLSLGEGNYRVWYRTDNSEPLGTRRYRTGYGVSLDQKLGAPQVTLFARFGNAQADIKRDHFYSGGLQFSNGIGFYPGDVWGLGYAHYDLGSGPKERLMEGYYNFGLTERLKLSFHVTHVLEKRPGAETVGYVVPNASAGKLLIRFSGGEAMFNARFIPRLGVVLFGMLCSVVLLAQDVKISDPTKVVMIVNRDSNDIAFMDINTHKMIGSVFLGNNVNPHMVMMSPDGRYVVTGGTRANKAYIIDVRTLKLVKTIPVDIAPEHLAFSPDGRWYYQGNPDGDSISIIDMVSLTKIKTIPGFVEPLNVTFTPDGSKAYVGNYGAHWVGVIDVRRHELLKKIQIAEVPGVSKLDPQKYLGEIKGINNASMSNDGRYLYAADTDLGVVGVIDTRDDKVIKVIRVGAEPWRAYMSHDGKYAITLNNGDETISVIDTAGNKVVATLEAGPDMTGVNFAAGKAFVISSTSGFVYVYNMSSLSPAGRIKIGTNIQIETATTDTADQKIYLAVSTTHEIVIIDGRTEAVERVANVGLYPWGTHIMDSKDNYCH